MEKDGPIAVLIIVILLVATFAFASYYEPDDGNGDGTPDGGGGVTVLGSTQAYLASGKAWLITAPAVYANLNDGFTGNDPYILDVRGDTDYVKGHVPGAVNIPWREVCTEENLAKLPTNKQIVVYCLTGHTATQVVGLLNTLGYDAVTMKWAIPSWTTNTDMAGSYFKPDTDTNQFAIVTGPNPGTWADGKTDIYKDVAEGCGDENGGGTTPPPPTGGEGEDVPAAANAWLGAGKPAAVKATALEEILSDGDTSNDPFVMSIRSSAQYEKGHIPGAVVFNWKTIFTEENMSKLPDDDTQIVVVCYTGHTASQVTSLLGMNGFNATALKWGMTSWSDDTDVAPSRYNRGTATHNYEVCEGAEPGSMATAFLAGPTDAEIIYDAAYDYLSTGTRFIKADALADLLGDGDAENDPFVLSIRGASDYETAHIPGAVNMAWRTLFSLESLALLPGDDTLIVVVCYTGQTASHVTALLNVLGFNATTLVHGMCSWTPAAVKCFNPATGQADYPVVSGGVPGTPGDAETRDNGCGGDDPVGGADFVGSSEEWEIIRQACDAYISTVPTMYITNTAVYNDLWDGYTANDPYVLSIRSATDYELGHIPTAVNIGAGVLLEPENLEELPTDRQIVVYCYTGQGASHVNAILNIMGYDSISLKFGMCSWTDNSTIAPKCFSGAAQGDHPIITGSDPGDWDSAAPAD